MARTVGRRTLRVEGSDGVKYVVTLAEGKSILDGLCPADVLAEMEAKAPAVVALAVTDEFQNAGNNLRGKTSKLADPDAILGVFMDSKEYGARFAGATIDLYIAPEKAESAAGFMEKIKADVASGKLSKEDAKAKIQKRLDSIKKQAEALSAGF